MLLFVENFRVAPGNKSVRVFFELVLFVCYKKKVEKIVFRTFLQLRQNIA